MKKNILALCLSTALLVPAAAFAAGQRGDPGMVFIAGTDPGFYVGGGYTQISDKEYGVSNEASLGAVFLRGGYQVNPNVAFEARIASGVSDDKVEGVKVKLDDMYGAYIKAGTPTLNRLYPYLLVGWTDVKMKASVPGDSTTDKRGGPSYGLGVDIYITHNISANLEYAEFYNKTPDAKIDGLSLGVSYKF